MTKSDLEYLIEKAELARNGLPDSSQEYWWDLYFFCTPTVVLDLCNRLIAMQEALEYYKLIHPSCYYIVSGLPAIETLDKFGVK